MREIDGPEFANGPSLAHCCFPGARLPQLIGILPISSDAPKFDARAEKSLKHAGGDGILARTAE
jgi:hypothetical protein